jgi:uncharacterized protein
MLGDEFKRDVPLVRPLKRRSALLGMLSVLVSGVWARQFAKAAESTGGTSDLNVKITMRDGAWLSTDIYRPSATGRFPVILIRTCYTKSTFQYIEQAKFWTARGFVYVVQDVYGRGDSDGEFYPLVREARDGHDTIEWLGRQPWSTGKVGMLGNSYLGWTQTYAACEPSPSLAALNPTVAPPDPDRTFPNCFGIPSPAAAMWLAGLDGHVDQAIPEELFSKATATLPIRKADEVFGRHLKPWKDWIDHIADPAYWDGQRYQEKFSKSRLPILHISGWYDDVLVGTTENYVAIAANRNGASLPQKLVIGPWAHNGIGKRSIEGVDFGSAAEVDIDGLRARWFARWLKGENNGIDREPPVRLFVMGRNEWIDEHEWPIQRTQFTPYYLRSNGAANSRDGNGRLESMPPATEEPDRFRYDPLDPVPFLGTQGWHQVGGPDDFSEVEARNDILVYTTVPFEERLLVCGPIRVKLFASSSAHDTDWTAKLLVVRPDGKAIRLSDGIVRARFRHGLEDASLLEPRLVERYDIDLWSTCIEVSPGERLRLEVSSSAYGKFDRNLNTGGRIGYETEAQVADQTVFHDQFRASHILLPIVPSRARG